MQEQENKQEHEVPAQFLLDAMPKFVRKGEDAKLPGRTAWTKLDRCKWHDHPGPDGKLRLASRERDKLDSSS